MWLFTNKIIRRSSAHNRTNAPATSLARLFCCPRHRCQTRQHVGNPLSQAPILHLCSSTGTPNFHFRQIFLHCGPPSRCTELFWHVSRQARRQLYRSYHLVHAVLHLEGQGARKRALDDAHHVSEAAFRSTHNVPHHCTAGCQGGFVLAYHVRLYET